MTSVTIDVPTDLAEQFATIDDLRQTVYEDFVIEQRQRGNISLGRAAELLGMSYGEFFDLLGEKGLSFINASPQELEDSYQHFHEVMTRATSS
jgi:predicted HTH domain antitoxin